jgi:hypothetical protein
MRLRPEAWSLFQEMPASSYWHHYNEYRITINTEKG